MNLFNDNNYCAVFKKASQKFSLSKKTKQEIIKDRKEIEEILTGKDNRMIFIVGPCSAWPSSAVINYAKKLKKVSEDVKPFLKIILRVYTQKPRTINGWNGMMAEPDPFMPPDLERGVKFSIDLINKILKIGLPIADEALFLFPSLVLSNYLSWISVGARSSENQEHRGFASGMNMPVGIKNPTSGSIIDGINGVLAAQSSQVSLFHSVKKRTAGNPFSHLVLRGGQTGSNCGKTKLKSAIRLLKENNVKNPSIIIDASHGNCIKQKIKDHTLQDDNVIGVLKLIRSNPDLFKHIKGFMVESFLKDGAQDIKKNNSTSIDRNGLSVTDPCLSWDKTRNLIFETARRVSELTIKKQKAGIHARGMFLN